MCLKMVSACSMFSFKPEKLFSSSILYERVSDGFTNSFLLTFFLSGACVLFMIDVEDDENSYEALRKAMKEYLVTMREYYKAVRFCTI